MIYLLDEALIKASQLHEIQAAIAAQRASALSFNQMNARRQEQERAAQISRSLRTAAVLATHTVNLLWTLCLHPQSSAVLLRPEMVDRITASINTYVIKLAGPKRESILVKDSAACSYHHDQWLNVFTDIYLAFKDHPQFRLSVVKVSDASLHHHTTESRARMHSAVSCRRSPSSRALCLAVAVPLLLCRIRGAFWPRTSTALRSCWRRRS